MKKQIANLEKENTKLKSKLKGALSSIDQMKKIHDLETSKFEKLTVFLDTKHKNCKGNEYEILLK